MSNMLCIRYQKVLTWLLVLEKKILENWIFSYPWDSTVSCAVPFCQGQMEAICVIESKYPLRPWCNSQLTYCRPYDKICCQLAAGKRQIQLIRKIFSGLTWCWCLEISCSVRAAKTWWRFPWMSLWGFCSQNVTIYGNKEKTLLSWTTWNPQLWLAQN